MAQPLPQTVDDLGLQGCLALSALLLAQQQHVLVAPTRRMTLANMLVLREQGIIDVPWPEAQWKAEPNAEEAPVEQLHWKLIWNVYQPSRLQESLDDYLEEFPKDDYCIELRLRVWADLVAGEAERFFEQQLAKNGFDPSWALQMAFVLKDLRPTLSISQWRYCGWAATRKGASIAMQQGINSPAVPDSIYAELRRRVMNVSTGTWACELSPGNSSPNSALGQCFTRRLTRLGRAYWSSPPCLDALCDRTIQA